jgi:hypothetical protein
MNRKSSKQLKKRKDRRAYSRLGSVNSQKPKLRTSKRQQRLSEVNPERVGVERKTAFTKIMFRKSSNYYRAIAARTERKKRLEEKRQK